MDPINPYLLEFFANLATKDKLKNLSYFKIGDCVLKVMPHRQNEMTDISYMKYVYRIDKVDKGDITLTEILYIDRSARFLTTQFRQNTISDTEGWVNIEDLSSPYKEQLHISLFPKKT